MNSQNKASITKILFLQSIECVLNAINENKVNRVDKEIQYSLNSSLLLGLVLEGFINEIGEIKLDKFTWKELEKSSTPLKWRIISSLVKGFPPNEEPLQTIIKLQKKRNNIAHPKLFNAENDIIISNSQILKMNPSDDFELPNIDFNIYVGYQKLLNEYNSKDAYENLKKAFSAINNIIDLFQMRNHFEWINEIDKEIKELKIQQL